MAKVERLSKSLQNSNCTNALQTSHFLQTGLKAAFCITACDDKIRSPSVQENKSIHGIRLGLENHD